MELVGRSAAEGASRGGVSDLRRPARPPDVPHVRTRRLRVRHRRPSVRPYALILICGWCLVVGGQMAQKRRKSALFPGETAKYRAARNKRLKNEIALRRATEKVAAERRKLP